jgi:MFS family permease
MVRARFFQYFSAILATVLGLFLIWFYVGTLEYHLPDFLGWKVYILIATEFIALVCFVLCTNTLDEMKEQQKNQFALQHGLPLPQKRVRPDDPNDWVIKTGSVIGFALTMVAAYFGFIAEFRFHSFLCVLFTLIGVAVSLVSFWIYANMPILPTPSRHQVKHDPLGIAEELEELERQRQQEITDEPISEDRGRD